uniref:Uncharacterized protein n=1 Tax=Anguilla anguilla TaxID=7936 RepID=A0A0E9TCD9_ANGAN
MFAGNQRRDPFFFFFVLTADSSLSRWTFYRCPCQSIFFILVHFYNRVLLSLSPLRG